MTEINTYGRYTIVGRFIQPRKTKNSDVKVVDQSIKSHVKQIRDIAANLNPKESLNLRVPDAVADYARVVLLRFRKKFGIEVFGSYDRATGLLKIERVS